MQNILQDLRYGARMLLKKPGFTAIAVITLALGIGANTAIFSVVNGVLLRPLPYKEPGRLARVYSEFPTMNLRKFWISPPEFLDIQRESKSWESIGAWATGGVNLSSTGEPMIFVALGERIDQLEYLALSVADAARLSGQLGVALRSAAPSIDPTTNGAGGDGRGA